MYLYFWRCPYISPEKKWADVPQCAYVTCLSHGTLTCLREDSNVPVQLIKISCMKSTHTELCINTSLSIAHGKPTCHSGQVLQMPREHQVSGGLCIIGYPSETHLKLKCCEISFVHKICSRCPIIWKFAESTAVSLCKIQNDWSNAK